MAHEPAQQARRVEANEPDMQISRIRLSDKTVTPSPTARRAQARLVVRARSAAVAADEGEARDRQADAALIGIVDGTVEVAPGGLMHEQPGLRVDHAFGVERFQHALEPLAERVQAHERQNTLDELRQGSFAYGG
jgi:hypothetical protein